MQQCYCKTKSNICVNNEESAIIRTREKALAYFCTGYDFLLDKDWENAIISFERHFCLIVPPKELSVI